MIHAVLTFPRNLVGRPSLTTVSHKVVSAVPESGLHSLVWERVSNPFMVMLRSRTYPRPDYGDRLSVGLEHRPSHQGGSC